VIIIEYSKQNHKHIIHACAQALRDGKSVVYPTDTSYGLAVDANNIRAIKKLYQIKGRDFKKPIHVVIPSLGYGKQIGQWNKIAEKLAKKFWPGPLTVVVPIKNQKSKIKNLSAKTGFIGLRLPKNQIALDLSKILKAPITATSANVSNQPDCYSADEVIKQYKNQKFQPDIIINVGKLPMRKPSTLVKVDGDQIQILREGPVSKKQIMALLNY
jgi:L-threonylcarbamoyladenylate synthase